MSIRITKLAAIDIGSNGVRMLINSIYDDKEKITFNKTSLVRVPIRLGQEAFLEESISEINSKRLIDAMKAYKLLMSVHGVEDYRAYATSAMREVENGKDLVQQIQEKAGVNLEIIDGEKEANIIFSTELKSYVNDNNNYLYVDVGGGSTELTLLEHGKVKTSRSFPVGTVRWLNGKVDESFLKKEVKSWVKENCKTVKNLELIGSGGNINYIFKQSGKKTGQPLSNSYLNAQYKLMKKLSFEERLTQFNMKPDRADVIVPALAIFTSIMKYAKAKKIHVPKIGLSDGMIQYLYQTEYKDK